MSESKVRLSPSMVSLLEKVNQAGLGLFFSKGNRGYAIGAEGEFLSKQICTFSNLDEGHALFDRFILPTVTAENLAKLNADGGNRSNVAIKHWEAHQGRCGDEGYDNAPTFIMEVNDLRVVDGQINVDIASSEGDVDNIMCTTHEINTIPGTDIDTQCLHLSFNGDAQAMSVFKKADSYIIRLETGVTLNRISIDGEAHSEFYELS